MSLSVLPCFTPDASAATSAGPGASAIALPGTPANDTTALVSNLGQMPVAVQFFATNPSAATLAACTMGTGVVILPGQSLALGFGANRYMSCMTGTTGTSSTVSVTTGN